MHSLFGQYISTRPGPPIAQIWGFWKSSSVWPVLSEVWVLYFNKKYGQAFQDRRQIRVLSSSCICLPVSASIIQVRRIVGLARWAQLPLDLCAFPFAKRKRDAGILATAAQSSVSSQGKRYRQYPSIATSDKMLHTLELQLSYSRVIEMKGSPSHWFFPYYYFILLCFIILNSNLMHCLDHCFLTPIRCGWQVLLYLKVPLMCVHLLSANSKVPIYICARVSSRRSRQLIELNRLPAHKNISKRCPSCRNPV